MKKLLTADTMLKLSVLKLVHSCRFSSNKNENETIIVLKTDCLPLRCLLSFKNGEFKLSFVFLQCTKIDKRNR